jgi:hypothetical protein
MVSRPYIDPEKKTKTQLLEALIYIGDTITGFSDLLNRNLRETQKELKKVNENLVILAAQPAFIGDSVKNEIIQSLAEAVKKRMKDGQEEDQEALVSPPGENGGMPRSTEVGEEAAKLEGSVGEMHSP